MVSFNKFFLLFIVSTEMHYATARLPLEDVHCVKRCCSELGSSMGSILSGYDPSSSLENKIVAVANNPTYYQKTNNLKNWVKSVIKLYVDAFSSMLKNVSVINIDDYLPGYQSAYDSCITNCRLDEGTDSFIRYLTEGISSINAIVSKNKGKADKKYRKQLEAEASAERERRANYNHEEAMANLIRETQGHTVYHNPEEDTFIGIPSGYEHGYPGYGWPSQS